MKEQIVSFELAKLAKEKGFNEETYAFYDSTNTLINPLAAHKESNWTRHIILNKYNDGFVYNSTTGNKVNNYAAPTQSLLQKWLREKYNMEVLVTCNASGWFWEINKAYPNNGGTFIAWSGDNGPNDAGHWETYEEALETGLEQALKLMDDGDKNKV